jgi:hypothetical protein
LACGDGDRFLSDVNRSRRCCWRPSASSSSDMSAQRLRCASSGWCVRDVPTSVCVCVCVCMCVCVCVRVCDCSNLHHVLFHRCKNGLTVLLIVQRSPSLHLSLLLARLLARCVLAVVWCGAVRCSCGCVVAVHDLVWCAPESLLELGYGVVVVWCSVVCCSCGVLLVWCVVGVM